MKEYQIIFIFSFLYLITSKTVANTLDTDKIYIAVGRDIFPVNLLQNEITEELVTILPLKTKISNGTTNENSRHISLKTQIDISMPIISNSINAERGDIILYKGQELIILNEPALLNNINDNDYIKIGEIDNSDKLFDNISMNKSILICNYRKQDLCNNPASLCVYAVALPQKHSPCLTPLETSEDFPILHFPNQTQDIPCFPAY